jgi:uncharacterized protein DUF732
MRKIGFTRATARSTALATALATATAAASALLLCAPVHADPDTDFANQLHTDGIYGPKDYNAWIGKIACKRLDRGVDTDAHSSAQFVFNQLEKGSTTAQAYQFLGAALTTYCPDKLTILQAAAAPAPLTPLAP